MAGKGILKRMLQMAGVSALLLGAAAMQACAQPVGGKWMSGDFHTHTYLTDGSHMEVDVLAHAFEDFGLDWMANSEHGGAYNRSPDGTLWTALTPAPTRLGNPSSGNMWRWQSVRDYSYPIIAAARDYSYPIIAAAREEYKQNILVQGLEWNVPSHEHASVGIVGEAENHGTAIAQFEYLFDQSDTGTTSDGYLGVSGKNTVNNHAKAVAGATYLQAK
jgi:hypothetical protein